ncbi:HDOD domain-containing protein [Desulfovibrio sp. OttesenSCG-928-O18]|nr:HDOD domain-containing protein [Desulfovibrio sp. OttesenSCG-928-O18]
MSTDLQTEYKGRILQIKNLPALPTTLQEVTRLMESPDSSTEQIAKVISYDQALAAKVLRMVNSPIYGFPGRISSLQHALMLLGFNVIRGLIISTSVFDAMNSGMAGLWDHSLGCSLACAEIAKATGRKNPEEYAVAGLLHDLGKAVFSLQIPEAKAEVDALVEKEDISFLDAETRVLGYNHTRINKWLVEHWNLPLIIAEGMIHHHDPLRAEFHPDVAVIVQIGDFFARVFDCGFGGDTGVNALDPRGLKILGMNQKMIEELIDTVGEQIFNVLAQLKG